MVLRSRPKGNLDSCCHPHQTQLAGTRLAQPVCGRLLGQARRRAAPRGLCRARTPRPAQMSPNMLQCSFRLPACRTSWFERPLICPKRCVTRCLREFDGSKFPELSDCPIHRYGRNKRTLNKRAPTQSHARNDLLPVPVPAPDPVVLVSRRLPRSREIWSGASHCVALRC